MILEYIKKVLFFLPAETDNQESPRAIIKESLARRSVYQIKLEQGQGTTDRINFRPVNLDGTELELETIYQPFFPAYFANVERIDITIFLLPDATHPSLCITCNCALRKVLSNTRLRVEVPRHIERIASNKNDRIRLEPRHMPVLAAWSLTKRCDNIRLLKMFNPLVVHMPKGNDAHRELIDISAKGACLSLDKDTFQQHKKHLKSGQQVLLQMSFPGPDTTTRRHEFLVIAEIRYQRPNLGAGRMELGLRFDHSFEATPAPRWDACDADGIPKLRWLLREFRKIYLAEIQRKLAALCDADSLEAAGDTVPGDTRPAPPFEVAAAQDRLAEGVFRDFTPTLANIQLTLQYLHARHADDEEALFLTRALQQLDTITTKLENIHEMTRGENPEFAPLRLQDLLAQALRSYDALMRERGIAVDRHIEETLPEILGDGRQLRLLFKNLVLNAIEAMRPHGGRLRVTASEDAHNNEVIVSVQDMGGGIPGDLRAQVFAPYHGAKPGGGLGLGLTVGQRIATAHGGRIDMFSSLGEGATFTVRLPITSSDQGFDRSEHRA